jgi:hypothetical protein
MLCQSGLTFAPWRPHVVQTIPGSMSERRTLSAQQSTLSRIQRPRRSFEQQTTMPRMPVARNSANEIFSGIPIYANLSRSEASHFYPNIELTLAAASIALNSYRLA